MATLRWHWLLAVAGWLVLTGIAATGAFLGAERTVSLASHEATLRPDFSGQVVIRPGPVLPDVREESGSIVGVEISLGKTNARSVDELAERYAAIAANPDPQLDLVRDELRSMVVESLLRGAAVGALPILVWLAIGRERRHELVGRLRTREGGAVFAVLALVAVGLTQPWQYDAAVPVEERWTSLASFVGPGVALPEEAQGIEVLLDATTDQSRRLVESAISTYRMGRAFYEQAEASAAELDLRHPTDDETVVLIVSDRHDNIGMDPVARAVADQGGATAVFDLGDDTSTGEAWEIFSLDSVNSAFDDLDRWAVAGNHDHGDLVRDHLSDRGWTYFDDDVVDGPGGSRIFGADDPRSSGLGNWRDEPGASFGDVRNELADTVCAADEDDDRIATLLVHDAQLGAAALERGCVDLVIGGHTHVEDGPTEVIGSNGRTGYTYTVGTTGGAAYAIAVGGKLRRHANLALLTFRDGRPIGIQGVTLQTTGRWDAGLYTPLALGE